MITIPNPTRPSHRPIRWIIAAGLLGGMVVAPCTRALNAQSSEPVVAPVRIRLTDQSADSVSAPPANQTRSSVVRQANVAWVEPVSLLEDLDEIADSHWVASWTQVTRQRIEQLLQTEGTADPASKRILDQLNYQIHHLEPIIRKLAKQATSDPSDSHAVLTNRLQRIRYSLERRLAIWQAVHQLAHASETDRNTSHIPVTTVRRPQLNFDAFEPGWSDYLQLPELARLLRSTPPAPDEIHQQARKTLARLYSPALSHEQAQFLAEAVDPRSIRQIQQLAARPVDLGRLLQVLEKVEQIDSAKNLAVLNDVYQNLLWSGDDAALPLAQQIQTHYRNANCRLTISKSLINRLVPALPTTNEPFRDRILGAQVSGSNRVSNQIHVELNPDPNQIHLELQMDGHVDSRTRARQSGFTIDNVGLSRFRLVKRLTFSRFGIGGSPVQASSNIQQRLVGLRSKYDGIPIVGWLAHRVARNKIQQTGPLTRQIAREKLETTASQRFDQELNQALAEFREATYQGVLQPLIAMDLEPDPIETRTETERLVIRYCVAGRDQMAAFTARPIEPANSLLSVQLNESVINNLLNRIDLAGQTYSIDSFQHHLQTVFHLPPRERSEDSIDTTDVTFEFAPFDPLRVDFEDGRMTVTLHLTRLQVGDGKTWRRLRVRSFYYPEVQGMQVVMHQDPNGISLQGHRLRLGDQVALRTIFTALFDKELSFTAVPEGLAKRLGPGTIVIEQFVLADGWLGYSLADPESESVADKSWDWRLRQVLNR